MERLTVIIAFVGIIAISLILSVLTAMTANAGAKAEKRGRDKVILSGVMYDMMGTPYKRGGENERGVDCSGFVRYSFGKLGYDLPHSAAALRGVGMGVTGPLSFGDIIVFRGRSWHTGIYLENGLFMHASSSHKGVVLSSLYNYGACVVAIRRLF